MMENLNLNNFFKKQKSIYPDAVQSFCDFIDQYKKDNDWNQTFGEKVKFHDIPYHMQHGIILKYVYFTTAKLHINTGAFTQAGRIISIKTMMEALDMYFRIQQDIINRTK